MLAFVHPLISLYHSTIIYRCVRWQELPGACGSFRIKAAKSECFWGACLGLLLSLYWSWSCTSPWVPFLQARLQRTDEGGMQNIENCKWKGMFRILEERPSFRSQRTVTRFTISNQYILQNIWHNLHHLNKTFKAEHPRTSIVKALYCSCLFVCVWRHRLDQTSPRPSWHIGLDLNLRQKSQPNFCAKTTMPWI